MTRPLTISLGEILWDILPEGKTLGGAVANAAWHLSQLGADARIVSAVGEDDPGREILERLAAMGLPADGVTVLPGVPTSTVDAVVGADGAATYTIHENVAWDYLPVRNSTLRLVAEADALNFGTLAQRGRAGVEATHACLDAAKEGAIRFFDVNLRPPHVDAEVLRESLLRANVVKMNHEELAVIASRHGWKVSGAAAAEEAMECLLAAYPHLRHVIVTRGADGLWWQGTDRLRSCPAGRVGRVADTIGAGDSVTAACMMGLLRGWEPERIMEAATAMAAFVCGRRGGTPELPAELVARFA